MSTITWREGLSYDLDYDPNQHSKLYSFDWTDWLAEVGGDTIQLVAVTGDALTISNISNTATKAFFQVANFGDITDLGKRKRLTCTITTAGGQKASRSIWFTIKDV